jgi:hypothetical protein
MKTITITRHDTAAPTANPQNHPFRVVALGTEGAPSAVFVYARAKPGDPLGDVFQCVASLAQIDELPLQAPTLVDGVTQIPYYRTTEASFNFRTAEEAATAWGIIQTDVQSLLRNIEAAEALEVGSVLEITANDITAPSQ